MDNVYKFVSWDVPALETHKDAKVYIIMDKLNRAEKLTRDEKDYIYNHGQGYILLFGYCYNFKRYMHKYLVRYKYIGWRKCWACDKTSIRNADKSQVLEIIKMFD